MKNFCFCDTNLNFLHTFNFQNLVWSFSNSWQQVNFQIFPSRVGFKNKKLHFTTHLLQTSCKNLDKAWLKGVKVETRNKPRSNKNNHFWLIVIKPKNPWKTTWELLLSGRSLVRIQSRVFFFTNFRRWSVLLFAYSSAVIGVVCLILKLSIFQIKISIIGITYLTIIVFIYWKMEKMPMLVNLMIL